MEDISQFQEIRQQEAYGVRSQKAMRHIRAEQALPKEAIRLVSKEIGAGAHQQKQVQQRLKAKELGAAESLQKNNIEEIGERLGNKLSSYWIPGQGQGNLGRSSGTREQKQHTKLSFQKGR